MSNMSYCRFQNTLQDLRDCAENTRGKLSPEESRARIRLIRLCQEIANDVGDYTEDELNGYCGVCDQPEEICECEDELPSKASGGV